MQTRWIFIAQMWACTALATEPGNDFSADITWPLFAQRIGESETVPLHLQVTGCDDVRMQAESREVRGNATAPWHRRDMTFTRGDNGAFSVDVDVLEHLDDDSGSCFADAENPTQVELQVVVTCLGDGRQTTTRAIPIRYAAADTSVPTWGAEQHFPIDANRALTVGTGFIAIESMTRDQNSYLRVNGVPIRRPRRQTVAFGSQWHQGLVAGDQAFVSDFCAFPHCHDLTATDPVTGAALTTRGSTIFRIATGDIPDRAPDAPLETDLVTAVLEVPGIVTRMIPEPDGSVLVVTDVQPILGSLVPTNGDGTGWVVSRIDGERVTTVEVVKGSFMHRHAGDPASLFAISVRGDSFFLHNLRHDHESQPIRLPGIPVKSAIGGMGALGHSGGLRDASQVSVAPDGKQWAAVRGDGLWLSDGLHHLKLRDIADTEFVSSVAWQERAAMVVFWRFEKGVTYHAAIFDRRTGQETARFEAFRDSEPGRFLRVQSIGGNRFVAADSGTMTVVDEGGHTVAKASLPKHCAYAQDLKRLPDGRVSWLAGDDLAKSLFTWDVSAYTSEATP